MIQELYLCDKCDKPEANYEGPSGEQWCVDCYSNWCDYEFELQREEEAQDRRGIDGNLK